MKIFLIRADTDPETIDSIIEKLKGQSNQIVYWIGVPQEKTLFKKPPETIFHNMLDATRGIPAKGIDITEFPPPGKDLIEQLYKVESIILTMMNRRSGHLCTDERKHLYYNMLRYWHGVLKKYRPDIIIHNTTPHDVCSYLIYELAHLFNIKTVMLEPTKIPGRLLTCTDFRKGSEELHQELQKNQNKNFRLDDLSKDLQEYYKLQTIRHDTTPADVEILKSQHSGYNLFVRKFKKLKKSIKQGNILQVIREGINRRLKQNLKKEYKSVQTKPDLNKKFIYVPLPVQPERNTCPLGDIFVDQILMIETLSASLPSDWVIYVKEHPIQWLRRGLIFFDFRYQGYYKKIAQLKNVRVIPIETDTYTLIEKSQAVAIATGTIGWEATLKGKPALVFGYPWYKSCSEIFRVKDVESCKEAIKKIINGFAVNQQKIINYLKCFDNATIHGYINPELEKNPTLTKQENINNIIQRILLEMHE